MAYKKTYRRRKNYRRRYHPQRALVSRRQPDAFDYARTAYTGVKKIWKLINTEHHFHDISISQAVSNVGSLHNLAVVPIGDGPTDRTGIAIRPQSINFKLLVRLADSASIKAQVRMIILRGKNENATNIVKADFFAGNNIIQQKVYDKRFKTKFLMDKVFNMTSAGGNRVHYMNFTVPLNGHINYDINTVNGTVYEAGGLYAFFISTETAALPTVDYTSRLLFTDN